MSIVVYSKPNCQPCKATYRQLDKLGLDYTIVDTAEDSAARDMLIERGFQESPVVIVTATNGEEVHAFSGYRPHFLKEMIA